MVIFGVKLIPKSILANFPCAQAHWESADLVCSAELGLWGSTETESWEMVQICLDSGVVVRNFGQN